MLLLALPGKKRIDLVCALKFTLNLLAPGAAFAHVDKG